MTEQSFEALIVATQNCNRLLYQFCCEQAWESCPELIAQRENLLAKLSLKSDSLNEDEIAILGLLYQNILANDSIYLTQAEIERTQVRKQLWHLKKAEKKALPAYREHTPKQGFQS